MLTFGWLALGLVTLVVLAAGIALRFADGPIGPLPGGRLRTGERVEVRDIDWSFARDVSFAEIQLEDPPRSRKTGLLEHEGKVYVPCDLGFVWRRVPPPARWLMALVGWVKRWHHDVLMDGRIVVRVRGRRYACQAIRIDDPDLVRALSGKLESRAESFLGAPLAAHPDEPGPIWFFRLDPRPAS